MKKIKFTKHAMRRASERKLWKYVNKEKFYYDAIFYDTNRAKLEDVIYAFVENEKQIIITTMYKYLP